MARELWLWSSCIFPLTQFSKFLSYLLFPISLSLLTNTCGLSDSRLHTHCHPLIHQIFTECPPSARYFSYTDDFNTHLVFKELIVHFFSLPITACEKGPHVASIGKINKFWGGRGSGIFLALLWLNVVPASLSLTPMLVTGCRKVICAGEWHHFFLFLKKGIYASLPILKFCDCMILN